jgi:hypothetical protein
MIAHAASLEMRSTGPAVAETMRRTSRRKKTAVRQIDV